MNVTEEAVRTCCTKAVFNRGETYLADDHIHEIHRLDTTVTAVVRGSRHYDTRADLAADGFDPRCSCPYNGPGACKHVVAVLLRCVEDLPPAEDDRVDAALDTALNGPVDDLRGFLRETMAADPDLRDRFLARFGESTTRSRDALRSTIDRQFEETNPEHFMVFEPIDFSEWFDLATTHQEQGQHAAAATVYRALVESLEDNMERVDGAYHHFTQAFTRALDGYVDAAVATARESRRPNGSHSDSDTNPVDVLKTRAESALPHLAEQIERAVEELQQKLEDDTAT